MPYAAYDYHEYLLHEIKYPEMARTYNLEATVTVKFVVNEDGSISDCKVLRSAGGGGFDKEALRVVKNSPQWVAGKKGGAMVKAALVIPIDFRLFDICEQAEQMPFPRYSMSEYLSRNLRYPETDAKEKKEGRVLVKFVVNEDGTISDCEVKTSATEEFDKEAIRVLKTMPSWIPGSQGGKAVKVYVTQTVVFKPH